MFRCCCYERQPEEIKRTKKITIKNKRKRRKKSAGYQNKYSDGISATKKGNTTTATTLLWKTLDGRKIYHARKGCERMM